jgi:hypothetical protein
VEILPAQGIFLAARQQRNSAAAPADADSHRPLAARKLKIKQAGQEKQ